MLEAERRLQPLAGFGSRQALVLCATAFDGSYLLARNNLPKMFRACAPYIALYGNGPRLDREFDHFATRQALLEAGDDLRPPLLEFHNGLVDHDQFILQRHRFTLIPQRLARLVASRDPKRLVAALAQNRLAHPACSLIGEQ
jgi:hypothetical protein